MLLKKKKRERSADRAKLYVVEERKILKRKTVKNDQ
jgi:hypothetical protein